MKRLSYLRLLGVTLLGFAITMVMNTLEPALLGRKVIELVPEGRNTALGLTTFAGLIVAILVQPIVGVFSDRTRSRWGRRLPYMAAGTAMVIACLFLIAGAPAFTLVVVGMLLIQLSSNTVQGPWQALIPDQVPDAQRGQASGLKAMLDILAFVVGRMVAGQLVGRFAEWGDAAVYAAVAVPSVVYVVALAITAWSAREGPEAAEGAPQRTVGEALRATFSVDFRAHPAFGWWFANRTLFWAGFLALNTFLLFYLIDVVGMSETGAQKFIGTLSTILGAALILVSLPSGWLSDRIGRKPLVVIAGILAAIGTGVLLTVRTEGLLTVAGLIIGAAVGTFLAANWALVTDIVPREEAARYLGVANIATAGGSAIARFLGGALIDSLNRVTGTMNIGYLTVFGLALAFFVISAIVILPLPVPERGEKSPHH
jgi:MFS family permease